MTLVQISIPYRLSMEFTYFANFIINLLLLNLPLDNKKSMIKLHCNKDIDKEALMLIVITFTAKSSHIHFAICIIFVSLVVIFQQDSYYNQDQDLIDLKPIED